MLFGSNALFLISGSAASELDATMRVHGINEAQIALRKVGDDLLKNMRKAISDDPLGWADRTGMMPVPPIDFGSKDAGTDALACCGRRDDRLALGVAPSYLTPDERTALKAVSGQGGKPMTDVAGTLVRASATARRRCCASSQAKARC